MTERSDFAGGDQAYLRDVQYATGVNLDARAHLHRTYATNPQPFPQFAAELVDWPPVGEVVECGCGTGRFWATATIPRALALTLTDLSPGMVAEAVDRARASGFAQVAGRECDVQELPFDDASFDIAVANHMLYHVPDPDQALGELARVLRPDGLLLAATNGAGHMGEIDELVAECFGGHGKGLDEVFGIDTGERRLRKAFASVVWHAYDNDLVVDDPASVISYGLSYPPGEQADAQGRERFAETVRARFADGSLRIRTRAGAFVCGQPKRATERHPE